MLYVLVADDHAVVRLGLRSIIDDTPDLRVAAEVSTGAEVLTLTRERRFDVVLLDLTMPGTSGLEVLAHLRAEHPRLPVLVLSMHAEDQYAVRVLRAGAAGYLNKESAPERLVEAIRRVAAGGRYVSPETAERLLDAVTIGSQGPEHEALSDREFQVMRLLAGGLAVGEIADRLSLSVKTVSTYRTRVLEKLHMRTNADLTRYALANGLIE